MAHSSCALTLADPTTSQEAAWLVVGTTAMEEIAGIFAAVLRDGRDPTASATRIFALVEDHCGTDCRHWRSCHHCPHHDPVSYRVLIVMLGLLGDAHALSVNSLDRPPRHH